MKTLLSFVIPCYRSELTVEKVIDEIIETVAHCADKYDYEIICVNDCSPDNVISVLKKSASGNKKIKVIDLAKNSGKHAALMAGYAEVSGSFVVNLDDDGQCPIDKLWDLLAPLYEGYDAVYAKYPHKKQSAFKNFGSKINSMMANYIINKPKDLYISNFSVYKRFVVDEMILYRNPYPYNTGLVLRATSKVTNVKMAERERSAGVGHYTFKKSLSLWINGFTSFSVKPLRIATFCGALTALIGFVSGVVTIINKILNPDMLAGYSSLMAVLLFVSGMIMLMLGMIGEYIGRIYICINNSPQYVVRDKINLCETSKEIKNDQ